MFFLWRTCPLTQRYQYICFHHDDSPGANPRRRRVTEPGGELARQLLWDVSRGDSWSVCFKQKNTRLALVALEKSSAVFVFPNIK